MSSFVSYRELDELGETVVSDFLRRQSETNCCEVEIEKLVRDYLGLKVRWEWFRESDPGKIGFLSDGITPLKVSRSGSIEKVVFDADTIVLDRILLREKERDRRRFTLAHEAAHFILRRHIPIQNAACFHSEFDAESEYAKEELHRIFSLNECCADRLAAALLMPRFLLEKVIQDENDGSPVTLYGRALLTQEQKLKIRKMIQRLGVSYSAFLHRIRDLQMVKRLPAEQYLRDGIRFREECRETNVKLAGR